MALTQLYVDPSLAADSGTGTVGDPYGDLEYCIEQEDWDATNGIQVNIKAGTAELPAAEITTAMADVSAPGKTVAWVPAAGAPLVFRGYTSAANDGGIGVIDQGGASKMQFGSNNYMAFIDLEIYNAGAATSVLRVGQVCSVIRCHIHGCNGRGILTNSSSQVIDCYVHDAGGGIIEVGGSSYVSGNIASNTGTRTGTTAIIGAGAGVLVKNNIIDVDSTTGGISVDTFSWVENNSVYSAAGTGTGIKLTATSDYSFVVVGNLIEGFSGTGGVGINLSQTTSVGAHIVGGNSIYDCATAVTAANYTLFDYDVGNETLSASPFTDAANGDFSPVDTGSVKEGAVQTFWTV